MASVVGALVVVGTPIGNLGDLSPRAVEALRAADVIACEDTRHTRKLLSAAGITGKHLVAAHEHNEAVQAARLVERVQRGERVAVVSDAGMPGVSDPGAQIVAAAIEAGIAVEIVPGPSAVLTALVLSGLPADRFVFEGFLPRKGRERAERLEALAGESRTAVLFEAPHRLRATLDDLRARCGGARAVAVVRELTKVYEEAWRGTLDAAVERWATVEPRGEHVVVLGGAAPAPPASVGDVEALLRERLAAGADAKAVVAEVAAALGVPKRVVYDAALRLKT